MTAALSYSKPILPPSNPAATMKEEEEKKAMNDRLLRQVIYAMTEKGATPARERAKFRWLEVVKEATNESSRTVDTKSTMDTRVSKDLRKNRNHLDGSILCETGHCLLPCCASRKNDSSDLIVDFPKRATMFRKAQQEIYARIQPAESPECLPASCSFDEIDLERSQRSLQEDEDMWESTKEEAQQQQQPNDYQDQDQPKRRGSLDSIASLCSSSSSPGGIIVDFPEGPRQKPQEHGGFFDFFTKRNISSHRAKGGFLWKGQQQNTKDDNPNLEEYDESRMTQNIHSLGD